MKSKFYYSKSMLKLFAGICLATGIPAIKATGSVAPPLAAVQQNTLTVHGTVTEPNGQPIIGATVVEKGKNNGTATDMNGNFTLAVSPGATLVISYIGFHSIELKAHTRKMNITLEEESELLDEVVVVGFGTQKKVNLTGSVSSVSAKELSDRPVALVTQALQGMVPGLSITQSSGSLNSRAGISIRGTGTLGSSSSGSPLILIDGMEGDINALNPQDVESISVLKDASASSIYGSRAPFGVILVTTKSGAAGRTQISYSNSFRWNDPIVMPKPMDSYTFANYLNDASINSGQLAMFNDQWLANIKAYQEGTLKTATVPTASGSNRWANLIWNGLGEGGVGANDNRDYYHEFYRNQGESQEHNFSISGGTDKVTYYTSFNILSQDGLLRYNRDGSDRYTATVKMNYQATDWLRVNYSNRFIREKYHQPANFGDWFYEQVGIQCSPYMALYDPNGYILNQWVLSLRDGGTTKTETDNLYQQIQFELEPIKNWKTFAEVNYSIMNYDGHSENLLYYQHDVNGVPYVADLSNNYSGVSEDRKKENYMNVNIYTEYSFSLAQKHNFKALVGMQTEQLHQTQYGLSREGILFPGVNEIDGTSGYDLNNEKTEPGLYGSRNKWATLGYFARINYDYQGRYLVEASIRDDGSSRFRSGNRYVWSPSFSLGWNIAEEAFWERIKPIVSQWKLRLSYGQLANQNTNDWYPTYAAMGLGVANGLWLQNGKKPNLAWVPGTLANTDMTWEKVRTLNIGTDFGFFNNRLSGSFDYFIRKTLDMLGPAPERPATLGVSVPQANNTDLKNYGFELSIAWRDRLQNGLNYGIRFNLSDYQTVILRYPNITHDLSNYIAGEKLGNIYGFETVGIAQTDEEMANHLASMPNGAQNAIGSDWRAGDVMYKDLNGDGKIDYGQWTLEDSGDQRVIGNSTPRFRAGLELTADWKGVDFRAFFQGVLKRDYWVDNYYFFGTSPSGVYYTTGLVEHEDYFRDENTISVLKGAMSVNKDSYYPRPLFNSKNTARQTRYLQNAAYVRLKNLQIGYTLPASLTRKVGISKLRIYLSGENLLTFTKMKGMFDPEGIDGGWGGSVYPISRVYSVGLNLNL